MTPSPETEPHSEPEAEASAAADSVTGSITGNAVVSAEFSPKRDLRFWLVFVALSLAILLSALDIVAISTAAPTIVEDLEGKSDFAWVSAAYTLSSSACLPFGGKLAQIFGRRPPMLGSLVIFAVGSAVCGSAHTMTDLIVGRAIQGVGSGGIQVLTVMIIADLVPLRERGVFTGITGLVHTFGSIAGPFIGGALSEYATWRWLFYLNLPLCGLAILAVFFFLQLKTPRLNFREQIASLDWFGNFMIIASTTSCILALTWGGIKYPWDSGRILVPLLVGLAGLAGALYYEARWAKQPTYPLVVINNRTTVAGYIGTFVHGVIIITTGFYLPTWFQAVRIQGPLKAGLYVLPLSGILSPAAIVQGLLVWKTGRYLEITSVGWSVCALGVGLLIMANTSTSLGAMIGFQLIIGLAMGILYSSTFPVLAPLPLEDNPAAVSLLAFIRMFSMAWGVSISGAILQNYLRKTLPSELLANTPDGVELAYTIIPRIKNLPEPLRREVQDAFASSLRVVWIVMTILSGIGLVVTLALVRHFPLRRATDPKWGLSDKEKKDAERAQSTSEEEKTTSGSR